MLKFNTGLKVGSSSNFSSIIKKYFSHGPFNPINYKHKSVGTRRIT
jgi:hypothetical protein